MRRLENAAMADAIPCCISARPNRSRREHQQSSYRATVVRNSNAHVVHTQCWCESGEEFGGHP
jgi:hypothetical protein